MNHRERALAALNHREPDRVPVDLGSTRNTGILEAPYQALLEYLGLDTPAERPSEFGMTKVLGLVAPDEAVLQRLGVDFRGIYLGKADQSLEKMLPDGRHQDELGVIRQRPPGSHYFDVVYSPFDREITLNDIVNWPWPDPTDPGFTRGLREKALHIRETTDCALVLHLQNIVVHASQYMRGFERWYMDLLLAPDLIGALMDAILDGLMEITRRALEQVGDLIDVVSCSDDIADQRGPQMSPDVYRKLIKPRHRRYFDLLHEMTSAKLLYHSCGAVSTLIPDFIEMGVDFINPVQVSAAGMDTAQLKRTYGDGIGFWGAVDTMRVLPFGTPEDVRAEVRRRIRDLAPGGGYVLTAVHNIQPDVPAENIVAMYDAAREFGRYPIASTFFRNAPLVGIDVDLARDKSNVREDIDL
jgi:uroporphyrinogen decarboxylase